MAPSSQDKIVENIYDKWEISPSKTIQRRKSMPNFSDHYKVAAMEVDERKSFPWFDINSQIPCFTELPSLQFSSASNFRSLQFSSLLFSPSLRPKISNFSPFNFCSFKLWQIFQYKITKLAPFAPSNFRPPPPRGWN